MQTSEEMPELWASGLPMVLASYPQLKAQSGEMMGKKPKYYMQKSWVNQDWWIVAQLSNNLIIAHVPEEEIARIITDHFNQLPGKQQPKRKRQKIYVHLTKKGFSE